MILYTENIKMTIADDSPTALKIKEGFDYEVLDGEIVIGNMYTVPTNYWQLKVELSKMPHSSPFDAIDHIQSVIDKTLNLLVK